MRADLLHVVTCVANPVRWESRIRLYRQFCEHMLDSGVKLTTVECAYGDRPHELGDVPHVNHIAVRASARSLCWNKESLLNIGIQRLPDDANFVATLDADIKFRHPRWASETVHALQHYHVVQPWSDAYDLDPTGGHLELHRSFCKQYADKQPINQGPNVTKSYARLGHPGFAWAWTRQALDWVGGLIDTAPAGSSDHHMALGLIGRISDSIPRNLHPHYSIPMKAWERRAMHYIQGNVGYVPGSLEHHWHGAKNGPAGRKYVERWSMLSQHNFDPFVDIKKNVYGVTELSGNKPGLRHDLDLYFRQRFEDSNCVFG